MYSINGNSWRQNLRPRHTGMEGVPTGDVPYGSAEYYQRTFRKLQKQMKYLKRRLGNAQRIKRELGGG